MPRKALATLMLVPMTVVALAGCQSTQGASEEPTTGGTVNEGAEGGLPFDNTTDSPAETSAAPDPTQGTQEPAPTQEPGPIASTSPSNPVAGGGNDVIKWDEGDLSSLEFDVTCGLDRPGGKTNVSASEAGKSAAQSISITLSGSDANGLERIYINQNDDDKSLWYSHNTSTKGGGTLTVEGNTVTATGTAFRYNDFKEETPLQFEIKLTCDSTY